MKLTSIVVTLLALFAVAQCGWTPTFIEDFNNQKTLNLDLWTPAYSFSPAIINSEIEYYTPDAFSFTNTSMKIMIESRPGYIAMNNNGTKFNYTSGVITTNRKWAQTYGYFEMRARMPYGVGFWPAFWLLPNYPNAPRPFEIDVMEIVSDDASVLHTTYHCDYDKANTLNVGVAPRYPALTDNNYHSFGLQWVPGAFHFYFDRKFFWTYNTSCVSNSPAFLLANVAMGGWALPPPSSTVFPNYMEIDFIRAYSYSASAPLSLGGDVGLGITPGPVQVTSLTPTGPFTTCNLDIGPSPAVSEVAPGASLNYTFNATCSAAFNGIVQLWLNNYALVNSSSVVYSSQSFTTTAAGSLPVQVMLTVPANTVPGFYTVTMQLVSAPNYTPEFWGGVISMVGVGSGYTVGHKASPNNSPSSSSVPSVSGSASSTPSISSIASLSTAASTNPNATQSVSSSALPSLSAIVGQILMVMVPVQDNANIVSAADVTYALSKATGVPVNQMTVVSFNSVGNAVVQVSGVSDVQTNTVMGVGNWIGQYNAVTGSYLAANQVQVRNTASPSSAAGSGSDGITTAGTSTTSGAGAALSSWLF